MKSATPKVLHPLAGKPLLAHVLDTVGNLNPEQISVVIGHGAEQVKQTIEHQVDWVMQTEQLGTGHAVQQALPHIEDDDCVIIAYGDVPLTHPDTFQRLVDICNKETLGLLTVEMDDPTGYGRIVRDDSGSVVGIVEQKDASPEQLLIDEINSGMLSANGGMLKSLLSEISNDNAQEEYYLTDIFALAVQNGDSIRTVQPTDEWEVTGVNSRSQLAELERIHQFVQATELMDSGITLLDPTRVDIRGTIETGTDIIIDVNTIFEGDNKIDDRVEIGANCIVINSTIGAGTVIHPNSIIENSIIGEDCVVGPFARLRPGSQMQAKSKVGNFVELKNTNLGEGSKVNHLSYVGDAEIGSDVNVGAGTITCNYDGANKHRTVLEDGVFIGSNSALVAPIKIGKGSTVGAGATVTKDVGENVLAIARSRQTVISDWKKPVKKKQ